MVSYNPESKSRAVNREVLSELIKLHGKTSLGGKLPAYDGRKSLYTAGSLPFESEEFSVTLVDPEKKDKEKAEREYKITIRIAGRTDLYHLQQFLKGRQRDMPQETIQVLDVVLRKSPSWNYVTVSRSFFSTTFGHRGDIGEGLECWRGYYQSLRPTQMGLSLNIDISATSFFKPVTVVQFVLEFLNLRDASRPLTDRDRVKIKKALRGVRVETNHQEDQIRRYKITGITPVPMSQLIFPVDERGTRMSVVQYFMQRYKYNLQYTSWPCLQSGSDARPVYLPMEACKIVEGQRYSKKLNDKQVTNILRAICQRPQQREQIIREMVLHNKYAEDKFAQEFGINVCSDLVSVPARVLPPPMLRYHDSGKEKTCAPSVGQWNMINKKMINGGIIDNWACVSFSRMRPEEVHRFCCDLIQMCNMTGMSVNPRPLVDNRSANPNHIENALRDVYRRTTEMLGKQGHEKQLQLLIVILPEVSGSYGKIKKVCETDLGIVSQCCLPRHAARPNKQYLENVALKINVKVRGRNTVLERAFVRNGIPFVSEVPTIIFGTDVTHPPPGEDSVSSIAAVVASMDWPEITKYRGLVSAQPHRQEIIEDFFSVTKDPQRGNVNGGMIRELLIAFRRKTGRRPERILFYRDGVSEGQFSHVLLHEMDAIRKACASLEEGYMPPVTFVVVQKRHHTRLFPEVHGRRDMTDKSGNILPGTVVDLMICHPTEFDFYLCSHAGIQGTSRPTHYHVLYDENHFTADTLQSLTNNLCHTYARCTRAVSVVPPAYYAHLAAFRARYYVEGDSSDGGSTPRTSGQATIAREGPVQQSIPEMVLHNKYAEDKFAHEFGINVCSDVVSVPARVLPPPMLRYHDSGKEKTCAPSVGQWNMINRKMVNGGILDSWACVNFASVSPEEVHRFCCDLIQICNMTGMSVNPRPLVDNRSASPNDIENALRDVYRKTTEMLGKQGNEKQLQLLIVILPEVGGSYERIKKVCETELGIMTQYCCLPRLRSSKNKEFMDQYMKNVANLINLKVGGHGEVLERAFVQNGTSFVSENPQRDNINDGMTTGPNIFVDTPTGRITVQVPLNRSCYSLKLAVERKLAFCISDYTLRLGCGKPIEYTHTLKSYGLQDCSVVSMGGVKLLGGAKGDSSSSKKSSTGKRELLADEASCNKKSRNCIEGESVEEYVAKTPMYRNERIPNVTIEGSTQEEEVYTDPANMLGKSFIDTLMKEAAAHRSWNGEITLQDFRVVNGRVVCTKPTRVDTYSTNFPLDCKQFEVFLRKIFIRFPLFMDDLLAVLNQAQTSWLFWMIGYCRTHYAFKTIIERENSSGNVVKFYNGLKNTNSKRVFRNHVNKVECHPWKSGQAQQSYLFVPVIAYSKTEHKVEYSKKTFGPFQLQRNFNVHSTVFPPHLSDLAIALLLGTFMCKVIRKLLEEGWILSRLLGA